MAVSQQNVVITREMIESLRFVQSTLNAELMIPDLGKNGLVLSPYEKVDLSRFFSKRELGQSSHLDWCFKQGHLKMLNTPDNLEENVKTGEALKFTDEVKQDEKTKLRGEELPKDVPVTDREETIFDKELDKVEDREEQDNEETKLNTKRKKSSQD